MLISMHQASVPVFLRALANLRHVLELGEAHALARGFDPALLVQARLTPDMLPLARQVQIATDMATRGCARLAGVEPPAFPDEEVDFAGLYSRIDRARANVESYAAEQIDGSEARPVSVPRRGGEPLQMDGQAYLLHFLLPNLFFHCTSAYAILRQAGVALGKADFMGNP
ncbi:MAG: DUF1993 domain-containing protein [Pseudomonadota bacterium]|nr:DUF1993 domain-containing protein [Pseudomonadota bacterium]MDQ3159553.1 DUF1993 domain-containing protein [Pseudomonadota bacterium]